MGGAKIVYADIESRTQLDYTPNEKGGFPEPLRIWSLVSVDVGSRCRWMDSLSHHRGLYMYRSTDPGAEELHEQIHDRNFPFYDGGALFYVFELDSLRISKVSSGLVHYRL